MPFHRNGTIKIGLNLRVYAPKPELVEKVVADTMAVVERASTMELFGRPVIEYVNLLVQSDKRFVDCDCGKTVAALEHEIGGRANHVNGLIVGLVEFTSGDLYVGANNEGVQYCEGAGMTHAMFLSAGLLDYFVPANMALVIEALECGALATGVAMEPFVDSVMAGRLLDTFDVWQIQSLKSVGGFDLLAAQPRKSEIKGISQLYYKEGNDWVYTYAGVEEMVPLIRLVRKYGTCIAPIMPAVKGEWKISDDPEVRERERKKILSKEGRQKRVSDVEGVSLNFLAKYGVMKAYRK